MTMNTSLQTSSQCASDTEKRCENPSIIVGTRQSKPRVVLSARNGKAKFFLVCEAGT